MNQRFILLIFAFVLSSNYASAGKIEKGFKSLEVYDYFDAKNKFEKKLKKSTTSPAAFGLATIYFRQDNPFHSIDSAYNLIRMSEATFPNLKEKKAVKYQEYGFSMEAIKNLKNQISGYYFDQLTIKSSINEWNRFISRNPEFFDINRAFYIRDSLAFGKAKSVNTTRALKEFLEIHPNSELKRSAIEAFHMAEYREQTMDGTVFSYEKFIEKFSSNPYVPQAQDQIYDLTTKDNTVEVLNAFIKKYPDNRNKEDARRRLYQVYMYEYSDERIEQFETEFPNYPFSQELKTDLQFSRLNLFPFRVFNKFGAMDVDGDIKIPPIYESMGLFSEGLSMVGRDGKLGFINKQNELIIPCMYNSAYDFEQGRAIVELEDKYGLIDRTGKILLPIEFDDIGSFSEGLIYAQQNGKYGYYDKFGQEQIKANFSEAYGFSNGIARIQVGEKQSFINKLGEFLFPPTYEELNFFTGNSVVYLEDEYYGLKTMDGNEILPANYDYIGPLADDVAMISEDGAIGYIDSLGKVIITPRFEEFANSSFLGRFENGVAIVRFKGKMGVIDKSGKFVVKNIYSEMGKNSELIAFNKGKLWGYLDRRGKIVIQPKYSWSESFVKGAAIVMLDGKQGLISTSGKELIAIEYDEITRVESDFFIIEKETKRGLVNQVGKLIVPVEYQEIRQLNELTFVLVKGNQLEYLYLPDNSIVQQK